MRWVVFGLITAEEMGITQANVNATLEKATDNPDLTRIRRFLGVEGDLGSKLGLPDDFMVQVIRTTGNYGEIYNRHLGPDSVVPIPRGLNNLSSQGGVLTAPPFQ